MSDGGAPSALAAIDIGTNSFHLVVARPTTAIAFEIIAREKEVVRLGSGSGDMKKLAPDAIDRGIAALTRFRKVADISDAPIRAIATSAVREAHNRDEFVRRARDEAGVDVEVVSGVEEARLIHLGVLQDVPAADQRLVLIDIGGGSTEFVVAKGPEMLEARSLKLGAIRLTDRFFPEEPITSEQVKECRIHIQAYLGPVVREVERHGFDVAIGSSGTILNLAEMARQRRGESGRLVSNAAFTRKELGKVVDALVDAPTAKKRTKVPGLDAKRADIIVAGALLLEEAFDALGIEEMTVSDYALREGLVLDALQRQSPSSVIGEGTADIRERSVRRLSQMAAEEAEHVEQSRRLALDLFDGTAAIHGLYTASRELLAAAALLANVGVAISHERHHHHSYYVIRNAEHLRGFTQREVELIAQVARYHRKSAPKNKHEAFASLSSSDQHLVRTLAGILRVAIALDRSHDNRVAGFTVECSPDAVVLKLEVRGDPSLELYTADERKGLLEQALDTEVRFEV
ncbi:MAG TPA: Ppx/GppA phosphatase family protein [Acidimicrobiales bacterium]|nr:Ppx/GppA phosphatase family protein [Acidimicrobiales bacterium]